MFSYRISGKSDVITAFFEGYDKAVRPGFGKIQETLIKKKRGGEKIKVEHLSTTVQVKKTLPPTQNH